MRKLFSIILALSLLISSLSAFAEVLSRGSKGSEVATLQEKLNSLGYDVGNTDGDFGQKTENALKEYQHSNGLQETGVLDETTYHALFAETDSDEARADAPAPSTSEAPILAEGSKGDEVKALQEKLADLGYTNSKADGCFGKGTEEALRAFQLANDLSVTGTLDKASRACLFADGIDEDQPAPLGAYAAKAEPVEDNTELHGYRYYLSDCSWEEACNRAISMGGYLVNINSADEYMEIQSELLELGYTDVSFWIGAKRAGLDSSFAYNWIGEGGLVSLHPIDYETQLDGVRPWAIGEPTYRNAAGEEERYARMLYRPEEARWVWEDTDGQAVTSVRTGYIVELDDADPLFVTDYGISPTLEPMSEPEPSQTQEYEEPYSIKVLGMEENTALLRVTAQEPCSYLIRFWNIFNDRVDDYYYYYYGNVEGGTHDKIIRVKLFDEHYNGLAAQFQIRGDLHKNAAGTKPEAIKSFLATDYCHRYGLEKNMDDEDRQPLHKASRALADYEDPAYRVTTVRASDPIDNDTDAVIEVLDESDRVTVMTSSIGAAIYLRPGTYIIHTPDNMAEDVIINVSKAPLMVTLQDQPLAAFSGKVLDADTGEPAAGVDLSLEVQGRNLNTTTDENGIYQFSDLPTVKALLSTEKTWRTPYAEFVEDVIIGPQMDPETILRLEQKEYTVFFGYWLDGSGAWYNAVDEFHKKESAGVYATDDPWFLGKTMFVVVDEGFAMLSPDHDDLYSTEFASGTAFNIEHDYPMDKIARQPDPIGYVDGHFRIDGVRSELLVITGYVREDKMKENNLHFNEWFEGWSDQLIEIEDMDNLENAYYKRLFQKIAEGVNPLKDDILYQILKRHMNESGLTDDEFYRIVVVLDDAPEIYRNLYLLTLFQYELKANVAGDKCYYSRIYNTLQMQPQSYDHFIDTFFHESGYAAQFYNWGYYAHPPLERGYFTESENEIYGILKNDVEDKLKALLEEANESTESSLTEQQIQALLDTFISAEKDETGWFGTRQVPNSVTDIKMIEVYTTVRDELEHVFRDIPFSNASMVEDIFGGFTNNKLVAYFGSPGHGEEYYWYDTNGNLKSYMHLAEAWAEFFSAKISNDEDNIKWNREYFPTATAHMEKYAIDLKNYYLERLKQRYPKVYEGNDEVPWTNAKTGEGSNSDLES